MVVGVLGVGEGTGASPMKHTWLGWLVSGKQDRRLSWPGNRRSGVLIKLRTP